MGVPTPMTGYQSGFGYSAPQQNAQQQPMGYGNTQQPLFNKQPQQPYASQFGNTQAMPNVQAEAAPQQQTPPQPSSMEKDDRGVPAFLRRRK